MARFTYLSQGEAALDKEDILELAKAMDAAKSSIKLDDCRLWVIQGSRGYASTWGNGVSYLIHVVCRSTRHWTATKKSLSYCELTQDGDDEGCFRLRRLPTARERAIIRKAIGVHQRRPTPPNAFSSSSAKEGVSGSSERLNSEAGVGD